MLLSIGVDANIVNVTEINGHVCTQKYKHLDMLLTIQLCKNYLSLKIQIAP